MALERLTPRQPNHPIAMSIVSQQIPVERLWELYSYNPFTGKLWSRRYSKPVKGTKRRTALDICIPWNGKKVTTNYGRVVYAWCTGAWPTKEVDHLNRDWSDNRISNLRSVTSRANSQNRTTFNGGAEFHTQTGRWTSRIRINGKRKYLGIFHTKAEAQAAYARAASELP